MSWQGVIDSILGGTVVEVIFKVLLLPSGAALFLWLRLKLQYALVSPAGAPLAPLFVASYFSAIIAPLAWLASEVLRDSWLAFFLLPLFVSMASFTVFRIVRSLLIQQVTIQSRTTTVKYKNGNLHVNSVVSEVILGGILAVVPLALGMQIFLNASTFPPLLRTGQFRAIMSVEGGPDPSKMSALLKEARAKLRYSETNWDLITNEKIPFDERSGYEDRLLRRHLANLAVWAEYEQDSISLEGRTSGYRFGGQSNPEDLLYIKEILRNGQPIQVWDMNDAALEIISRTLGIGATIQCKWDLDNCLKSLADVQEWLGKEVQDPEIRIQRKEAQEAVKTFRDAVGARAK